MSKNFKGTTGPGGVQLDPAGFIERISGTVPSAPDDSFAAWVRREGDGYVGFGGFGPVIFATTTGSPIDVRVYVDYSTHTYFVHDPTNGDVNTGASSVLNQWDFVALRVDGGATTSTIELTINGTSVYTTTMNFVWGTLFGYFLLCDSNGFTPNKFDGSIVAPIVYSRSVSASEWATQSSTGFAPVSTTAIFNYVRMAAGGSATADTSGNGFDYTTSGTEQDGTAPEPTFATPAAAWSTIAPANLAGPGRWQGPRTRLTWSETAGIAAMAASGGFTFSGTAGLTGSDALAGSAAGLTFAGTAGATGSDALAASAAGLTFAGTAGLLGTDRLITTGDGATFSGTAGLLGSDRLVTTGAGATFAGTAGLLGSDALVTTGAGATFAGTAAATGSDALAASGGATFAGTAGLLGTDALAASGTVTFAGSANLTNGTSQGAMDATGGFSFGGTADLSVSEFSAGDILFSGDKKTQATKLHWKRTHDN